MLDEIILTETPPLYQGYSRVGQQQRVWITGGHAKCVLHGALNIGSGDVVLASRAVWTQETHQAFLQIIRSHWRGWHIVLFEDRGSPHTATASLELAADLQITLRFLPRATPELNAMDHLWRQTKPSALANRSTVTMENSVVQLCEQILALSPRERLKKAGVLSGHFWLAP